MKEEVDRRKWPRFRSEEPVFIEGLEQNALLHNSSFGGLAFRYPETELTLQKRFEINLVANGKPFFSESLRCEMVNDFVVSDILLSRSMRIRQCCLSFDKLSPFQLLELEMCLSPNSWRRSVHKSTAVNNYYKC